VLPRTAADVNRARFTILCTPPFGGPGGGGL